MFGSLLGNVIGISYFLTYQAIGICVMSYVLKKESTAFKVLMGSVWGSFSLQWVPVLTAFFMGFTKQAHVVGLLLYFTAVLIVFLLHRKRMNLQKPRIAKETFRVFQKHKVIWLILPTFIYFVLLLSSHTIFLKGEALYTGQATFGDMNMHLGFITSIAKQGTFPPEYSILSGVKLSYPFLCDSISSSVYVFGSSLRVAYILPMAFAILQVFLGFYAFAYAWLKHAAKACLAWVLFFFNGGFGFVYFLDQVFNDTGKFTNIFTGFYNTPTSLGDKNLRWAQLIVNMLIPQRATLFGWAVLFPLLALLYLAMRKKEGRYFILAGLLAGGLPLIHTHSFLALGLVCVVWVLFDLYGMVKTDGAIRKNRPIHKVLEKVTEQTVKKTIVIGGLLFFSVLQVIHLFITPIQEYGLPIVITAAGVLILFGAYLLYQAVRKKAFRLLFHTWGVFLILVLVLALPQLIGWTFQQASGDQFVRGHFNWSNEGDPYIWFYVKNVGVTMLFAIPALIYAKTKDFFIAAPAFAIWFIGEFLVFQPNVYDNNKLLFVGFVFLCCLTAGYMLDVYRKLRITKTTATVVLFLLTVSALLTMGREYKSGAEYELYGAAQVKLAKYIEENVPTDAVILTNTRHNNAVSSLTGRSIVCGAGTFLYYHGLDYGDRERDIGQMYRSPEESRDLLKKYNVSYILVGPEEYGTYNDLNEEAIRNVHACVYQEDGVSLYRVSP